MIALLLGMVTTSDCQQRNPDTDNMLSENLCLEELLCFCGVIHVCREFRRNPSLFGAVTGSVNVFDRANVRADLGVQKT